MRKTLTAMQVFYLKAALIVLSTSNHKERKEGRRSHPGSLPTSAMLPK